MGMPEMVTQFREAAGSAVTRSKRGIVAIILEDSTKDTAISRIAAEGDIGSDWTATNAALIRMALEQGARSVIAARRQEDIAGTLGLLRPLVWHWLCAPGAAEEDKAAIAAWIDAQRAEGKSFKAVLAGAEAPNSPGVVNFATTGIADASGAVDSGAYTAKIAGMLAGISLEQSLTYKEDADITGITDSATPDADVDAGKLILFHARDKFRFARGVTSLTEKAGVPAAFKKIKNVEGCDTIADDIRAIWEDSFIGQVPNSVENKNVLVAAVNTYLETLQGSVLSASFENRCELDAAMTRAWLEEQGQGTAEITDEDIINMDTGSAVFLLLHLKLMDAMEDLTLGVYLN